MKNNNGITLIALLITLIVMLILVGVTVTVALSGGLFGTARQAKEETRGAQVQEQVDLWKSEMQAAMVTETQARTTNQEVDYLVSQGILTEEEGNRIKSGETEITIGSRNIDFSSAQFRTGAGLFATKSNERLISWEDLTSGDDPCITVSNSVITASSISFKQRSNDYIGDLVIPEGITQINSSVFNGDEKLTDVVLPNSLSVIENYAFKGCTGLTNLTILDSIESIGSHAFANCTGLEEVRVKNSNFTIAVGNWDTFSGCTGVKRVIYEEGVTNLVAIGCIDATDITIPSTATTIGNSAFSGYRKLTEFNIPNTIETIGQSAFSNCEKLTQVTIPNSVRTISSYAFRNCPSLSSFTIGESVQSIGGYAFANCTGLEEVRVKSSNFTIAIGNWDSFNGCTNLERVIYEEGVTNIVGIGCKSGIGCTSLTSISIPTTATTISANAFNGYGELTQVNVPSSVSVIGNNAFSNCTSLIKVYIDKLEGTISGSPWGTTNDKIRWKEEE